MPTKTLGLPIIQESQQNNAIAACLLYFLRIQVKYFYPQREEILALKQPGLLPLSLLTRDIVNGIMVKAELLENNLNNLLPVGYTIATWVLRTTDLAWLEREYDKMLDFFKDSPAYEWMTRDAREEGRQETQRVLDVFRQTVVALVAERFPKWAGMAQKQVQNIENPQKLQEAILFISATQDAAEVANILANLDEGK